MKFRLVIVIFPALLLLSSCNSNSVLKSISANLNPNKKSYIGSTKIQLLEAFGEPLEVMSVSPNRDIYYYKNRWYILENNSVKYGEIFESDYYVLTVKSISQTTKNELANKSISIHSGMENLPTGDIEFQRNTKSLAKIFEFNGLKSVKKNSDLIVLLSYGISDPIVDISTTYVPTFGWVPGQSHSTTGVVGTSSFSATTTSTGQFVQTGGYTKINKSTSYKRFLVLNVYQRSIDMSEPKHLWKYIVESTGATSNLDELVQIMISSTNLFFFDDQSDKFKIKRYVNDPTKNIDIWF